MSRADDDNPLLRRARWESLEERLVLSAQPAADFFIGEQLELHDESLEYDPALEMHLADAHETTGVNFVYNAYGFDGSGQTVVVIDSGIAYDHLALGGGYGSGFRVVGGWDFAENDANPYDDGPSGFHGTHVAGIIASNDPNNRGVAPDVDLVALRVFNDTGGGYFSYVESALRWVIQNQASFAKPITTINLSLGTDYNTSTPPNWALLEDELAQLKASGIFIAVSAGNGFSKYQTPGLSNPASSPYVVPVSSVTNAGIFSTFSQRDPRVLAAPGQFITSTIPSHVFGKSNDFASASGTSMAAPYVAGASVLVREAFQFVGRTNITQDMIYDHLRATADPFYDSVTKATYYKINVQRALEAIMPADEYGSTAATAFQLGSLKNQTLQGTIGRIDDVDYFSFTAVASGQATFTIAGTHDLNARWTIAGGATGIAGNLTMNVVAGQTYKIGLSTAKGVGHYTITIDAPASATVVDWGAIAGQAQFNDISAAGETWYRVAAGRTGQLTAEAFFNSAAGNASIGLYNANMQLIASGSAATGGMRADVTATAGQTFYLRVTGTNPDVDFRFTNLVAVAGGAVDVFGGAGADSFSFTAGAVHKITVAGVSYEFAAAAANTFRIHAGAGVDQVTLTDGAGNSTADVAVGLTKVSGADYTVTVYDAEQGTLAAGAGPDSIWLRGTTGADEVLALWNNVTLTGSGYRFEARGYDRVDVESGGGNDYARFYGSSGVDNFVSRDRSNRMYGAGYLNAVWNFQRVDAYAEVNDIAQIWDTSGDDTFTWRPDYTVATGSGLMVVARGFGTVYGHAENGGYDQFHFHDSAGDDTFVGKDNNGTMNAGGYTAHARGFEKLTVWSLYGGNDRAWLYGSSGDDTLITRPDYAQLTTPTIVMRVNGFGRVDSYGGGGMDRAYMYDSAGTDSLTIRPTYTIMTGSGYMHLLREFERVEGWSSGGNDVVSFHDSPGTDDFTTRSEYSMLVAADGFVGISRGFARVYAWSYAGGLDRAHFHDTPSDDHYVGTANSGVMTGGGMYRYAGGFSKVYVWSYRGGSDTASLEGTAGADTFRSSAGEARLTGTGYEHSVNGMKRVSVAGGGGFDEAFFEAVGSSDVVFGRAGLFSLSRPSRRDELNGFEQIVAQAAAGQTAADDVQAADYVFQKLGTWQ